MVTESLRKPSDVVLHVISSGGLYGIERMLLNLLPELQRQGCPVALLCLDGQDADIARASESLGIPTAAVDATRRIAPRAWRDLYRKIGAHRPRLVHVHGYKATILAGAAARARRVPLVATYHSVAEKAVEHSRALSGYLAMETLFLRRCRAVAAVSEQIARELEARRVLRRRIRVIPNGIATPVADHAVVRAAAATGFRPSVLSLSRLAPEKNVDLIIAAIAALRTEFPQIGLVVAGDGPLLEKLRAHAATLGVQDSIRFVGFVREVNPLFQESDAFVLASQTEGMPIALLEAMAHGIPIVASRVGGIPSMVDDECDALLVEPRDLQRLVKAIRRVIGDKQLRTTLAAAAQARFQRDYSAEGMARSYIGLYDEAVSHQ